MDSVRFGRALGIGARAAAKTLVTAVDAATSPNPSATPKASPDPSSPSASASSPTSKKETTSAERLGQQAARATVNTTSQVRQTKEGLKRGSQRFGEAAWGPFVKLSGVLWLELTGVFFGIFALFAGTGAWKLRGEFHDTTVNHIAHVHLLFSAIMAVVFTYFCISSFVKASRRQHGR